jgi:hypothetical protein
MDLASCPWQVTFERVRRFGSWRWEYVIADGEKVLRTSGPNFRHRSEAEAKAWAWMKRTLEAWDGAESETITMRHLAERMGAVPIT